MLTPCASFFSECLTALSTGVSALQQRHNSGGRRVETVPSEADAQGEPAALASHQDDVETQEGCCTTAPQAGTR